MSKIIDIRYPQCIGTAEALKEQYDIDRYYNGDSFDGDKLLIVKEEKWNSDSIETHLSLYSVNIEDALKDDAMHEEIKKDEALYEHLINNK